MNSIYHPLHTDLPIPQQLNNPFSYSPDPLCMEAVRLLQEHIITRTDWYEELREGKMFGVLVVEKQETSSADNSLAGNSSRDVGFLAAYSGQIGERSDWDYFVPAVFDYLQPDGYFKSEERHIDAINAEIAQLIQAPEYQNLQEQLRRMEEEGTATIEKKRQIVMAGKMLRRQRRQNAYISEVEHKEMIRESQFQKAELHRTKKFYGEEIERLKQLICAHNAQIKKLKKERRQRSDALQKWLFQHFEMLNSQGERKDLLQIFEQTAFKRPPAGAGECCEPKLLQYAYSHHLRPVSMAMFWWGCASQAEIRHHFCFYPACSGKCKPILQWMLDQYPDFFTYHEPTNKELKPRVVYEDDVLIVINKPAGMLSVPGIDAPFSVFSYFRHHRPEADSTLIAHRLDMPTSGLMVLTKTREANRKVQIQFMEHTVRKRYVALLDGIPSSLSLDSVAANQPDETWKGTISLPLRPDIYDRPRQIVDHEHGKVALTHYEIIAVKDGKTRIKLFPHTGRTHQLRVHCAHAKGLNTPICGDRLYGKQSVEEDTQRLHLHAEYLELTHPITNERMSFYQEAPF